MRMSSASRMVAAVWGSGSTIASACSKSAIASRLAERATAFTPCLVEIADGLVEHLASHRVVRQHLDLLGETVRVQPLHRRHDGGVKDAPALLDHAGVRHLVREGVLERVLEVGKGARLVQEFRRLQLREGMPQSSSVISAIASRSDTGTSLPTTEAAWSSRFSSGRSRSMRAARIACTVAGTWMVSTGLASR